MVGPSSPRPSIHPNSKKGDDFDLYVQSDAKRPTVMFAKHKMEKKARELTISKRAC